MSKKQLKTALLSMPAAEEPKMTELFPMTPVPDGYDLTREEEFEVLTLEVEKVRKGRRWLAIPGEKKANRAIRRVMSVVTPKSVRKGLFSVLKPKRPSRENLTLRCFARVWERKRKEELLADETYSPPGMIVSDLSGINAIVDAIKAWKIQRKTGSQEHSASAFTGDCFGSYVSLADV